MRKIAFVLLAVLAPGCTPDQVLIGSKDFTESYVLAEVAVRALERDGLRALHRPGMGGTIILWQALRSGAIQAYGRAADLHFGEDRGGEEGWGVVLMRVLGWTLRHLQLVAVSLFLAILAGIPLGIRGARQDLFSRFLLGAVGVIYTIPSLALPTILAGIKTSAVINVATATLAALIGVGGLGEPILSGINLNDGGIILQGAVPAALLALGVQALFDGLEARLVSPGLRMGEDRRWR